MMVMKLHRLVSIGLVVAAGAITAAAAPMLGGPPTYDLSWHTIDGGGGTSTGGAFTLSGTIGQHDAGPVMTGGGFALSGGFWAGAPEAGSTCPADIANNDNLVNVFDLLALLGSWGTAGSGANIAEPDNIVNVFDLLALLGSWGMCP